jgi:predicted regulator of Ras-like GTPase activity (Roadblock/LC7/MglB family)
VSALSTYEDEQKKILIAGLPGAGLRTIKAVVVDNTPPTELKAVMEKLDVGNSMRDLLQRKVLVVRCGGEYSIQDVISSNNDPIYKNVEALVFVLDINEQSKFSIAKYWFDALVKHLQKFSSDARIYLLLNKIDKMAAHENISDYLRATKNLFIDEGSDVVIHETSIYDASTFYAFKDVLMKEVDDKISVKQFLKRSLRGSSFLGVAVYSKDGLPIYGAGELPLVVEIAANVMLDSVSRISDELDQGDEISSTILQMKKKSFMIFKSVNENCVFIGLSKRRPKLGQMLIETDQIVEVLRKAVN